MKKVREGYKMSELGEIPEEWSIVKLSDLSQKIGDGLHGTPKYVENSDYYFINGNNLVCGKVELYEDTKMVSEEDYIKNNKDLNENSLLISLNGTIGNVAYYNNEKIMLGKSSGYINLKGNINKKYIYYVLKTNTVLEYFNKELTGTTIKNLSLSTLRNTPIPLPNIREQEKIALILSTVDEQIDNVDALIEKKKELKKGLMQTLLTKGIGHTKFKRSEIGEIPEEWEVKKVGDICEVKGGKRLPKGYQLEDEDNAFPYIRVADMYMGGIRQDDIKYVPKDIVDKIKNYKISKDDLFISVAGTLGIVGQIPCELDGANLTENADKLCNIQINKLYLMKVLQSNIIQSIIEAEKTKSAQPKLALTRIKEFLIPVPSDREQVKIASILMEIDERINVYENKKNKLEMLKKGLMQKLLTGKIRAI